MAAFFSVPSLYAEYYRTLSGTYVLYIMLKSSQVGMPGVSFKVKRFSYIEVTETMLANSQWQESFAIKPYHF